jgi:hydroxypyruvate reductase
MPELDLRRDALACLDAAVRAVEPRSLTRDHLESRSDLAAPTRIHLVAVGKAAAAMTAGARDALGECLAGGVVIVPAGGEEQVPAGFDVHGGGHPIPDEQGVEGARAIRRLASGLRADDLLLCLISGGGSALMTSPPDRVSLAEMQSVTARLLKAGATIGDLNCARKHLDELKGGRLARAAAPARVLALVLSDVVGDPLEVIASGPVSPDPTTLEDAAAVLRRFGVWEAVPESVREHLRTGDESPKPGDPCFERVEARVIGNNRLAAAAALAEAERRGYRPLLLTTSLTGEAREVGGVLAAIGAEVRRSGHPVQAPACLVAAGETTVTVQGRGRGGRNQEVALGAAGVFDGLAGVLVAAMGTDGVDGPTDAAGAVADGYTVRRAAGLGLDPRRALADNDAYPFFQALDDLVVTGPTGTNVMDLTLVMVDGGPSQPAETDDLTTSRSKPRATTA